MRQWSQACTEGVGAAPSNDDQDQDLEQAVPGVIGRLVLPVHRERD
jgi:hypothetical protein